MTKYIHIHARCKSFEIFTQVTEKQAPSKLTQIKDLFNKQKKRYTDKFDDKLLVKTKLVNPEFNF